MRTNSEFPSDLQYLSVCIEPKDRNDSTAKKALIPNTLTNIIHRCEKVHQGGEIYKEFLPFLNEQGSVIDSVGEAISECAICASMFELQNPNSEKRKPNISLAPMKGPSSIRSPTKEFLPPTKSVPAKSPVIAQAKAKRTGMEAIPDRAGHWS
jgi:hypothetical protein